MQKEGDGLRILLGTTNPSKAAYFEDLLCGVDADFVTLADLGIADEPEECGATPEENAKIKAQFYGQFAENVICADSGLYFDELPMDDPRQPGLHVRTPGGRERLNDAQMVAYYTALARELGGRALAYYLDGCAVYAAGKVYGFQATREEAKSWAFYLTDHTCGWWREGWPLDSMSQDLDGRWFLDPERPKFPQEKSSYRPRLRKFLLERLGLSTENDKTVDNNERGAE